MFINSDLEPSCCETGVDLALVGVTLLVIVHLVIIKLRFVIAMVCTYDAKCKIQNDPALFKVFFLLSHTKSVLFKRL